MLTILSHRNALAKMEKDPLVHPIIFITNFQPSYIDDGQGRLPKLAKSSIILSFHDALNDEGPQEYHVVAGLEFAKQHTELIICCHAGVSRSSAMAYVIQSYRTDPVDALKVFDILVHFPNMLLVKHGAKILAQPEMVTLIQDFQDRASGTIDKAEWQMNAMKKQHGMKP